MNSRYRIGVINEFRDSFSFIDYKQYGSLEIYDACWTCGSNRQDGKIFVFLNFEKVGEFKSRAEAVSKLQELIAQAPNEFFRENQGVLLKGLVPGSYSGNTAVS